MSKKKRKKKKQQKGSSSLAFIVILIIAAFAVTTCSRKITGDKPTSPAKKSSHKKNTTTRTGIFLLAEDFESGSKTNYNSGDVELSSGTWKFKDAVTGNLEEDHKTGMQALRIRGNGMAGMKFDIPVKGTVTVTLRYAGYGADKAGTWELWASVNHGQSYFRAGDPVSVTSGVLKTATFTAKSTGIIRFDIRKTDAGNSRINFDVFRVTAGGKVIPAKPEGKPAGGDDDKYAAGQPQ
ncbi:hypothetical protein [Chitinophaga sp. OAE865]|uniref:hypothetical protein n=1 Tax=Chitinophaga sp. OAE865 TaxID=2817898 RepID=UPI003392A14C